MQRPDGVQEPMEAHILRSLQDIPGVVKLYESCMNTPSDYALVMELIRGIDLFDHIKDRKRLKEPEARRIFTQVLSIVRECHNRHIVHRDIKDENIILEGVTRRVRLIDFGASKFFNENSHFRDFEGTLHYAPPEWILRRPYDAEPSTVWQLGTLLFAMLNGHPPFEHKQEIFHRPVQWLQPGSASARELVSRCLNIEPATRPSLAQIATDAWVTCVGSTTVAVQTESVGEECAGQ